MLPPYSPNKSLFEKLLQESRIQVEPSPFFSQSPVLSVDTINFDRFKAMMLGLAIGDALGNTTEEQLPAQRTSQYGEIRDYLPSTHADNKPLGVPSDDSQMSFWTLEQILTDGSLDMDKLAQRFATETIFGIGGTVVDFRKNFTAGSPWYACARQDKGNGNGALMRIAPVIYPHLGNPTPELWVDAVLATILTHNDRAAISANVSFVKMLWELLQMSSAPSPSWWLEAYVQTARELEGDSCYRPCGGHFAGWKGSLWRFVEEQVALSWKEDLSVLDACNQWYSGAYLLETMPSVIYILMRHGHDLEEAVVRAVNDTKDNDTVAAIVGAAVGALHGTKALPAHWVTNLTGRTKSDDNGKMFAILVRASSNFNI